jgi:SagB-type dehydrogenase family enzyme
VTIGELGDLLHRTARVRSVTGDPLRPDSVAATSDRPYASPGASYELEIYATVNRCRGVPRGVYHYDPLGHRLELTGETHADIEELLESSRVAGDLPVAPAVLLTITARFRRVSLTYGELGYSLVLRNFGALTQLLALVCAALGLGGCRIDTSEIEHSSRILGLDWRTESSVGSFALGRPAPGPGEP